MDELEFVKNELEKHRGKGNTISVGEIAKKLGYPVECSHVKGRILVELCAKKYRIPVGANNSGYYMIATQEELDEYKSNLSSRAQKNNGTWRVDGRFF